ncbi:hypothetical protein HGA88_06320 [Candidatus Roizmanbacteria bacterium]|nr:hypothetical protein [Candidatus Roizmanbacteria bacterium]
MSEAGNGAEELKPVVTSLSKSESSGSYEPRISGFDSLMQAAFPRIEIENLTQEEKLVVESVQGIVSRLRNPMLTIVERAGLESRLEHINKWYTKEPDPTSKGERGIDRTKLSGVLEQITSNLPYDKDILNLVGYEVSALDLSQHGAIQELPRYEAEIRDRLSVLPPERIIAGLRAKAEYIQKDRSGSVVEAALIRDQKIKEGAMIDYHLCQKMLEMGNLNEQQQEEVQSFMEDITQSSGLTKQELVNGYHPIEKKIDPYTREGKVDDFDGDEEEDDYDEMAPRRYEPQISNLDSK